MVQQAVNEAHANPLSEFRIRNTLAFAQKVLQLIAEFQTRVLLVQGGNSPHQRFDGRIDENGVVDRSGETTESGRLESWSCGPGQTYQKFSRLFDICMMGTITPIDDQNILLRFNFITPKAQADMHQLYAEGMIKEIAFQVEQDIPIWEHKTYLESPILCDGDGPIAKYRKWFQQFYA